jgi:hypothetical protein
VDVKVVEGAVAVARLVLAGKPGLGKLSARLGNETVRASLRAAAGMRVIAFDPEVKITPDRPLQVNLTA